MSQPDQGIRNYNPSLAAQQTKAGKSYLVKIRKMEPYERLLYWIKERHRIHTTRFPNGMPDITDTGDYAPSRENPVYDPPFTDDPIMQTVFICNPYSRENDKISRYLLDEYVIPHADDKTVFLGTILLRWYNYVPTMHQLIKSGIVQRLGGNPTQCAKVLDQSTKLLISIRDNNGAAKEGQLFGGAYIIRPIVDGEKNARKVESIAKVLQSTAADKTLYDELLGKAPYQISYNSRQFERLGSTTDGSVNGGNPCTPGTMAYAFARLSQTISGMGKFYVYQFIGDLAYTHVLCNAPDWFTWGFCGPGTSRGLVRLKSTSGKATLKNGKRLPRLMPLQAGWQEQLLQLQKDVNRDLGCATSPKEITSLKTGKEIRKISPIHMRNLTGCLCEFDKYERALNNERSIKRPYAGT